MKAPRFWEKSPPTVGARALLPLAAIYTSLSRYRRRHQVPYESGLPVICVGNIGMGGSGKTPVTAFLAQALAASPPAGPGLAVHILSRGYGRSSKDIKQVDATRHTVQEVGDEPLLLSQAASVWVGPHRPHLAQHAVQKGAECLILDDGFQNNTLKKNLNLVVVDGAYGFGNGLTFPAGPLREPLREGLARADALIVMGADPHNLVGRYKGLLPLFRATFQLETNELKGEGSLTGKSVLAFAGIGHPEKFFRAIEEQGAHLKEAQAFADHHVYTDQQMETLLRAATRVGADLVTTEKDWWRLSPSWRGLVQKVRGQAVFDTPTDFINFVKQKCAIK